MRHYTARITSLICFFSSFCFYYLFAGDYKYSFDEYSRDPLYPLISRSGQILIPKEATISDFILQGVIFSEGGSRVVINNEILKEGNNIRGYTVLQIGKKEVILEKGGKKFTLKLGEE